MFDVKVAQSCLSLCDPMDYRVHGILQATILESVVFPFSRGTSQGIEPISPTLQAGSLPAEPQGKPKNTGVGSPSLLQWVFPTQESNWGLLHCNRILYQLSCQGSPISYDLMLIWLHLQRLYLQTRKVIFTGKGVGGGHNSTHYRSI